MEASDHNVYILGAGFSHAAGIPLVDGFMDQARAIFDRQSQKLSSEERLRFRNALDFKHKMAGLREEIRMELDNIETLFGLADMARQLGIADQKTWEDCTFLIAKTVELSTLGQSQRSGRVEFFPKYDRPTVDIQGLIEKGIFKPNSGYNPPKLSSDLYHFFAALISGAFTPPELRSSQRDAVITFNYDLVLDDALIAVGAEPDYRIPKSVLCIPKTNGLGRSVPLLKLHGSLNWGVCAECKDAITVMPGTLGSFSVSEALPTCPQCHPARMQTLLVPPTWDKSEYREAMRSVWSEAVTELRNATRICVIGYSVPETDMFFKYLLALGFAENKRLDKFTVIDFASNGLALEKDNGNGVGKLKEKYDTLLDESFRNRRFRLRLEGFESFFSNGWAVSELNRGALIDRF